MRDKRGKKTSIRQEINYPTRPRTGPRGKRERTGKNEPSKKHPLPCRTCAATATQFSPPLELDVPVARAQPPQLPGCFRHAHAPLLLDIDIADVGSVPDVVYALALCRGDTNASACESCVATAFRGAQQRCPLFKDVTIFYDLCQLRFSNRNFFLDVDYFVNTYYLQGSQVTSTPVEAFDAAVRLLVNATADYTAEKSSRKFGTGEEGLDKSNPKIYALSQCTPDKTGDICRTCLSTIIGQLPNYFNGTNGGGVFGVWCSFRCILSSPAAHRCSFRRSWRRRLRHRRPEYKQIEK
ncbi:cysteine-rich receptor-like protein kinase 6 [Phragmites australis]|uniref:cysteine-rich receptor-like protein kinase 6 n=1 Tax=Phragmites australis TaxID=29695 RepID=UPI002D77ECDF|nr:cysteine-rich receptor-like protein kinase 6 [Phragmites australis]